MAFLFRDTDLLTSGLYVVCKLFISECSSLGVNEPDKSQKNVSFVDN